GDAVIADVARAPFRWAGKVGARVESRVHLSIAWYPGWSVWLDGKPAMAGPARDGLLEFAVPPGVHFAEARWGRSPARRLGETVSVLSLLALAAISATRFGRSGGSTEDAKCRATSS